MKNANAKRCGQSALNVAPSPRARRNALLRIFYFYYDGFRSMNRTWRIVWLVVLVKLFIMFGILKVFFFPNYLNTRYDTDEQRSEHVLQELTRAGGK